MVLRDSSAYVYEKWFTKSKLSKLNSLTCGVFPNLNRRHHYCFQQGLQLEVIAVNKRPMARETKSLRQERNVQMTDSTS